MSRLFATAALFALVTATPQKIEQCRNIPGDQGWPSADAWQALNATVSGRLIKTSPAAHVCHDPTYDANACQALNSTWIYPWGQ